MGEHYTKTTVEVSVYCRKCQKNTMHQVFDGRKGSCQECIKRLEDAPKVAPPATQLGLF